MITLPDLTDGSPIPVEVETGVDVASLLLQPISAILSGIAGMIPTTRGSTEELAALRESLAQAQKEAKTYKYISIGLGIMLVVIALIAFTR